MYYAILVLALTVAALGLWVRRRSPGTGQALAIAGCVGAVACVIWQVRHTVLQPPAPGPNRGQAVVSYFLANQVLREVADRQGAVLLFFPPREVFDDETVGTYAGTFARVLRGFPDLKVEPVTLAAPAKAARAGQFTLATFQQAASISSAAAAYVSFAGVPAGIENFQVGGQPATAGFWVFDPWSTTNWLAALHKGFVRSVIVPRPGVKPPADGDVSGEPNAVFQQLYLQATKETADATAAQLRAP